MKIGAACWNEGNAAGVADTIDKEEEEEAE